MNYNVNRPPGKVCPRAVLVTEVEKSSSSVFGPVYMGDHCQKKMRQKPRKEKKRKRPEEDEDEDDEDSTDANVDWSNSSKALKRRKKLLTSKERNKRRSVVERLSDDDSGESGHDTDETCRSSGSLRGS